MNGELYILIDRILGWLVENLTFFSLPPSIDQQSESDLDIGPQRQAFGELALLCMVLTRHPRLREREEFKLFVRHLVKATSDTSYGLNLMRRQYLFPAYLMEFVGLQACGKEYPERKVALQRILDMGFVGGVERTAWNQMDFLYFLERGGFRHSLPDRNLLYQTSSVSRLPAIPYLRNIDVYALTHILFFSADFGRQDLHLLLGERFSVICEEVTLLLGTYIHEQDWDLVAELLMCCICLRQQPSPLFELGFQALFHAQLTGGDIPGKAFDPGSLQMSCAISAAKYRFWQNYHPTLVTLASAALNDLYQSQI